LARLCRCASGPRPPPKSHLLQLTTPLLLAQMDFALQKNRQSMGRRYIEVFRAKKGDYYTAVAAHVSDPGPLASGPGMMAPGAASIPAAAMHAHAMVAYANHQLVAQPVGTDAMPAPITVAPGSGDSVHVAAATVLPVAVTAAPATSDGTAAGSPAPIPFPAFPSSGAVAVSGPAAVLPSVRDARQPRATEGNGGGGGGSSGAQAHTGVLKLRGLPFSASKDDIITFFDDPVLGVAALVHDSIHIVTSLDGRPSGVAFAEFASSDDARQAMRKDRCSMGSRYVELFPSSREEATRAATAAR
jgi:heterogeneous nuclear ribonucleoprotein F/H